MQFRTLCLVLGLAVLGISMSFSCDGNTPPGSKTEKARKDGGGQATPDQTGPHPDQAVVDRKAPTPDRVSPPDPRTTPDQTVQPDTPKHPEPTAPDTPSRPEPNVPDRPTEPPVVPEKVNKPDTPKPSAQEVRFIVMGDTGTGSAKQKAVAQAIQAKCAAEAKPGGRGPCEFALLLGDNFYDIGVASENDPLFKTHFADMYHMLGFPFYITIGNHDYGVKGIGGAGFGFNKLKYYTAYAKKDPKFILPQSYYAFDKQHISFISLNTAEVFFDYKIKAQTAFVRSAIAKAKNSVWKIAFGHHPYISNGTHGNAGKYEGIPIPIPYVSGRRVKRFFDNEICGKIDYYFCGHDHNIQILAPKCGTGFAVSGAGAKNKKFGDPNRNKSYWQSATILGFLYVHIKGRTMTIQVINDKGKKEFEKTFSK